MISEGMVQKFSKDALNWEVAEEKRVKLLIFS